MSGRTEWRGLALAVGVAFSAAGCMALPMAAGKMVAARSQEMTLAGQGDSLAAFRKAVGQAGGVVTVDTREFVRGEFSGGEVRIEARLLGTGPVERLAVSTSSGQGGFLPFRLADVGGDRPAVRVAAIMETAGFRPEPAAARPL